MNIQVLGDSYAKRFFNFSQGFPGLTGTLRPILIKGISGARVNDLKNFVKVNISAIQPNIPLLFFLGTNDFFANVDFTVFKNSFLSFLRLLRRTYPGMAIVFTTLPNYPRIRNSTPELARLGKVNRFLLTLRSDSVKVIELTDELNQLQFFHAYYGKSNRHDGIHFNDGAFGKLIPLIENSFSQVPT